MKKKIKLIAIIVVIIAIVVLGFLIYRKNYFVDTKYIHNKLEKFGNFYSKLITATQNNMHLNIFLSVQTRGNEK